MDSLLYQYSTLDQQYQMVDSSSSSNNNNNNKVTKDDNDIQPAAVTLTVRPDYIPAHLPAFPPTTTAATDPEKMLDTSVTEKRTDLTTIQTPYPNLLSSLLPSTDHKLSPPSSSKKANDNPFTHVVSFDESSLASGNGLFFTLASSSQQKHKIKDDHEEDLERAKKRHRAEINGSMESTVNTIMQQYHRQQHLYTIPMDGNQRMFQHITQNEAAPGKTLLGTRDGVLDEMVYRLAPPVALARLSSPNLVMDTTPSDSDSSRPQSTPTPTTDTPGTAATPPPPPLPLAPPAPAPPAPTSALTPIPALASISVTSPSPAPAPAPVSAPVQPLSKLGSHSRLDSPQPKIKAPMSIATFSARGDTNASKKGNNGDVSTPLPPLPPPPPKKIKKPRRPSDLNNTLPPYPPTVSSNIYRKTLSPTGKSKEHYHHQHRPAAPLPAPRPQPVKQNSLNPTPSTTISASASALASTSVTVSASVATASARQKPTQSSIIHPIASIPPARPLPHHHSSHPHQQQQSFKSNSFDQTPKPLARPRPPLMKTIPVPPTRSDPAARYTAPVKKPTTAATTHPSPTVTILKKKKKRQDAADQSLPPSTLKVRFEEDTRPPPPIQQNGIKHPFASYSHPSPLPDAAIKKKVEPAYNDTSETVRCICENPTVDYGTFMISCDSCLVWFHGSCVGITEQMLVEEWICSRCR